MKLNYLPILTLFSLLLSASGSTAPVMIPISVKINKEEILTNAYIQVPNYSGELSDTIPQDIVSFYMKVTKSLEAESHENLLKLTDPRFSKDIPNFFLYVKENGHIINPSDIDGIIWTDSRAIMMTPGFNTKYGKSYPFWVSLHKDKNSKQWQYQGGWQERSEQHLLLFLKWAKKYGTQPVPDDIDKYEAIALEQYTGYDGISLVLKGSPCNIDIKTDAEAKLSADTYNAVVKLLRDYRVAKFTEPITVQNGFLTADRISYQSDWLEMDPQYTDWVLKEHERRSETIRYIFDLAPLYVVLCSTDSKFGVVGGSFFFETVYHTPDDGYKLCMPSDSLGVLALLKADPTMDAIKEELLVENRDEN